MMTNDTEVIVNPKTADIKVIVGETDRCKAVGVDNLDDFRGSLFTGKFENVKVLQTFIFIVTMTLPLSR